MHRFYILISVLFSLNIYSQEQFNRIDTLYNGPTIRNVIIHDYYYTLGGSSLDGRLGIAVCKYNNIGDFLYLIYYSDTITWFHGAENSLKETGTEKYILGAGRKKNWYTDNLLIKFDNNFDTIFTKTYYPVDDNGYKDVVTYGSCVGKDTSYLLVGTTNIDNNYDSLYQYQMQLIKTDTLGDLLWRKTYGNDTYKHYGYKVENAFDGGYILGGWSNINSGDWAIVKVDENGENPIFKYFGNTTYDDGRIMGITPTTDSCYIITGSKTLYYEFSYEVKKARIIKLDNNLNTVWDKLYLNSGLPSFFYNVLEKENGNLVAHGGHKNSYNYTIATILELTSEGDSIWRQETTSYDTIHTNNYLESGKITPDGGMVFGGYTYNSASLTPAQQMWLVKTDSMGCDGTEWTCDLSYLEELASKNENGLLVYPNPVTNSLTLSLSKREGTNELQNSKSILQNLNTTNTANLPPLGELKGAFNSLAIDQKLKYNIAHPDQKLWTEKEEQEMRELSRKFAYAFPFEVIKGKVDIFAIDPSLSAQVESRKLKVESETKSETRNTAIQYNQILVIYDIFGKQVLQQSCHPEQSEGSVYSIDVSNLQNGVYFVQVGESVAKFVKE